MNGDPPTPDALQGIVRVDAADVRDAVIDELLHVADQRPLTAEDYAAAAWLAGRAPRTVRDWLRRARRDREWRTNG